MRESSVINQLFYKSHASWEYAEENLMTDQSIKMYNLMKHCS